MSNLRLGLKTRFGPIREILGNDISLLLDLFTGAVGGYSLRNIREEYTGSLIRVRRDSDNTEQDIGFNSEGNLDVDSLSSFCTGANGFVSVWYDQAVLSSNLGPNSAFQATATLQPKIYDSVTGIYYENSRPTIYFDNKQLLINNLVLVLQPVSYFITAKGQATARQGQMLSKNSFFAATITDFPFVISLKDTFISASVSRGNDYSADAVLTRATTGNLQVYSVFQTPSQLSVGIDSNLQSISSFTQSANTRTYSIGRASFENGGGVNTSGYTGFISEIIIYPTTQLSNRIEIEKNIQFFYNILL